MMRDRCACLAPTSLLCMTLVEAEPVLIRYRCGGDIDLVRGVFVDGWTPAKAGRLPGKAGHPCWSRVDVGGIAPDVLAAKSVVTKPIRVDALVEALRVAPILERSVQ